VASGTGLEITFKGSSHDNYGPGGFDLLLSLSFRRGEQKQTRLPSFRDRRTHQVLGHCYRIVDAAPPVIVLDVSLLDPSPPASATRQRPPKRRQLIPLLGLEPAKVAAQLKMQPRKRQGRWLHFDQDLAVRCEAKRCTRIAVKVPTGLTCSAAAEWIGYQRPAPPLRRRDSCEWPGISRRHRLARGHAAKLDLQTSIFELWLTK